MSAEILLTCPSCAASEAVWIDIEPVQFDIDHEVLRLSCSECETGGAS